MPRAFQCSIAGVLLTLLAVPQMSLGADTPVTLAAQKEPNSIPCGSDPKAIVLRDPSTPTVSNPLPLRQSKSPYIIRVLVSSTEIDDVKFEETPRKSRLVLGLESLLKHYNGPDLSGDLAGENTCNVFRATGTLEKAYVKVTAFKGGKQVGTAVTVVTGPAEHLYITAGLPVSNRKVLKYDSASGTLQPSDSSAQFYAGVGYQFGDLLVVQPEDSSGKAIADQAGFAEPGVFSWRRMSAQVLLQASSKPLSSVGLAFGYSLPPWPGHGIGPISVFFGRFWTQSDSIVNGRTESDSHYSESWRAGVSFSISDALTWIKN